jgi:hypothetical protein
MIISFHFFYFAQLYSFREHDIIRMIWFSSLKKEKKEIWLLLFERFGTSFSTNAQNHFFHSNKQCDNWKLENYIKANIFGNNLKNWQLLKHRQRKKNKSSICQMDSHIFQPFHHSTSSSTIISLIATKTDMFWDTIKLSRWSVNGGYSEENSQFSTHTDNVTSSFIKYVTNFRKIMILPPRNIFSFELNNCIIQHL